MAHKVCFIGGARYSNPLDATSEKKFRALQTLGEVFVIGFSQDLRPKRFDQHARFYLVPQLPFPVSRYVALLVAGVMIGCWVAWRHGVRTFVAQSPYEGLAAAIAKKLAGWFGQRVALVVESHGDFEASLFLQRAISLPGIHRRIMAQTSRFAFAHADSLRVISDSTRKQLERWTSGKPTVQFPAWTDIDVFLEAGRNKNESEPSEVLYTGVLIPRKGVHHLIGAVAAIAEDFPRARLVIVGREEDKIYAAELKKLVDRLHLHEKVQFLPPMPQSALAKLMSRARVFVLPSLSEGLGRVIVEAMATGTPAIGSRVGGIPEMIRDGTNGFLVTPGDESALAEKLRWVLCHPRESGEMGRQARRFAENFFSTRTYVAGYRELLESCGHVGTEQNEHAPSTL